MVLRVVIRGSSRLRQQVVSFGFSGTLHTLLLGWLVWAAAIQAANPTPTLYDLAVKPSEKHIVWYNLRDKLPDVKPAATGADHKTPRARVKFNQSIVAGNKDDSRTPQKIVMPAPPIELPKVLPLPNMLAVKESSRLRSFAPPVSPGRPTTATPVLPEAPSLESGLKAKPVDVAVSTAKPVRQFLPPPNQAKAKPPAAPLVLPEAPRMTASAASVTLPVAAPAVAPQRLFSVPAAAPHPQAPEPAGPVAPELSPLTPLSASLPRIPRGFTPPPSKPSPTPAAPSPIQAPPVLEAPSTAESASTLAIVGLNPTPNMEVPPPRGSHEAGFSAAVKPEPSNSESTVNESAAITVPGLSTRGGAADRPATVSGLAGPNPRQSLLAALHEAIPASVTGSDGVTRSSHVVPPPDERLHGRFIYTLAIQMPNVTSYSGSWMVWFAEHQPEPGAPAGEMKPPVALHKVDPKYVQAAAEERVEGTVRLAAVIRKTGQVESVELLQHLDARLDRSAQEALAKWVFEPARHNGNPVDIDAVFEIPFRLAPKPKR